MPHRSIGVQVASKCRGARRKLPSAAASRHKAPTVKPTTNNMTQRERETALSKFNSRFIRRFGVCVRSSGLQCRRHSSSTNATEAEDGRSASVTQGNVSPREFSIDFINTTREKASETRTVPKEVRGWLDFGHAARGGQLLASPSFVFCTDSWFINQNQTESHVT